MPSPDPAQAISVSELTAMIKGTLEMNFSSVWVSGEVTDIARPRSGHIYLTLKDGQSQIRGIIWRSVAERLPFDLDDGQAVICFGSIDVYAARGSYQLVIRKAEPQGIGALQLAFRQMQQRLADEGLFAPERKRPLPNFPKRVGFVTSPTGAAVRDFLEVALRRWPGIEVIVIPAKVQGAGAARSICEGIIAANAFTPSLDVLVVGRGGGSLEDLWCFNEELVVRALAASTVPTVSAVGHEIDVTLSDLAADARALTPTAAAEMVVPDIAQLHRMLDQYADRMLRPIRSQMELYRERLRSLERRPVFTQPFDRLQQLARRLDELDLRSRRAIEANLRRFHDRLQRASATLAALSPLATLSRGYSATYRAADQGLLRSIRDVQTGEELVTQLGDGRVRSTVSAIEATGVGNGTVADEGAAS
ncbi:exodeoxyribonuclease VII large subunit [Candidatus Laterigemmans baculatus]|uniref:exodeoxyribonuclease VII large subunit n=1 Tax=Candidatus Laterigemmans baculatus TaxID=2770505 RepID=UPI0013DAE162|nr:exodeoxyribonuclease VII large subunit [Candidatus Laterigemmans baculatus]